VRPVNFRLVVFMGRLAHSGIAEIGNQHLPRRHGDTEKGKSGMAWDVSAKSFRSWDEGWRHTAFGNSVIW